MRLQCSNTLGSRPPVVKARKRQHAQRLVSRPTVRAALDDEFKGQISSDLIESMACKIRSALNTSEVSVLDVSGDGQHVSIEVVAEAFAEKSSVDRQRMVYKAIWEELQSAVHAVDEMKCQTPSEANSS